MVHPLLQRTHRELIQRTDPDILRSRATEIREKDIENSDQYANDLEAIADEIGELGL